MTIRHGSRRKRRKGAGFTLLETMVALVVTSLLFFGALDLFLSATRATATTSAKMWSGGYAANGLQRVMGDVREALYFALPYDRQNGTVLFHTPASSLFAPALTTSVGNFEGTDGSGAVVNTGIELTYPALVTTAVSVLSDSGSPITVDPLPYNGGPSAVSGTQLWIFRSDSNGTPNAQSGKYLWAIGQENGQSINIALVKDIQTGPGAVQFVHPKDSSGNILQYQVEVRIVTSDYSPVGSGNAQISESQTGAASTLLTGKCVRMRNHETNVSHEPTTTQP